MAHGFQPLTRLDAGFDSVSNGETTREDLDALVLILEEALAGLTKSGGF